MSSPGTEPDQHADNAASGMQLGTHEEPEASFAATDLASRNAILNQLKDLLEMIRTKGAVLGENKDFLAMMQSNDGDSIDNLELKLKGLQPNQINAYVFYDGVVQTALHITVRQGLDLAAKALIDNGASVSREDEDGNQPLHVACDIGSDTLVQLLLEKDADIHAYNFQGWSPIFKACWEGHENVVKRLLDLEDTIPWTRGGDAPLHMAAAGGNTVLVEYLIEKEAPLLDYPGEVGMTPLHNAVYSEKEKAVKLLLTKNAKVDLRDNDGWTPLMTATKARNIVIMKDLLAKEGDLQADIADNEGCTPLLIATKDEFEEGVSTILNGVSDDHKLVTIYQTFSIYEESAAYGSDSEEARKKAEENLLNLKIKYWKHFDDNLLWAASKSHRHEIAKGLLLWNQRDETMKQCPQKNISTIELAAERGTPKALWWLIATSPSDAKTRKDIKSALRRLGKKSQTPQQDKYDKRKMQAGKHEDVNQNGEETKAGGRPKDKPTEDPRTTSDNSVLDILQNPPIGLVYKDSDVLVPPKLDTEHSGSVKGLQSRVIRFYKARNISSTIRSERKVEDVIYNRGPAAVMDETWSRLRSAMPPQVRNTYDDQTLKFTWIHLPATNIDWMKDLVLRIMADGNKAASSYHKLSSFLQSTWFEIPDQASASRIMRPQFSERVRAIPTGRKQDEGTLLKQEGEPGKGDSHDETREGLKGISSQEDSGKKTSKPEAAKKAEEESDDYIASSAVYMPFLSFSTEFQAVKNSTTKSANQPVNQPANPSPELPTDQSDYESISNPDDQPTRRARFAKDKVERFSRAGTISSKLMESYENSVIHGSATLDESYYHFSQGDKAQKDRLRRNGSQVVTKQLESSCEDTEQDQQCEGEQVACWPLLRVNQVWIWTIDEKWLISATSHPVDDVEQLWIDGFIEYLDKQARVGGAQSQPESTKDMMKTIVDYCIGSYERKRTFDDFAPRIRDSNGDREANWKDGPSIRQLFSDYINYIGRKETSLFDEFRVQIQNTVTSMERDKRYEESILKAVSLFSEIKDIRDELNILKSTANYQNAVQQKLFGQSSANSKSSTLAANYIVNDIIEMDRLASRVQSAVDATLTLQHSEIANFQARKATEQGEEARTQGKSLMVFTGATILFLPMSFFTSLFALDVKSFQEAPSWVFGVIFGVSMAFSIVCVLCAVNSESISEFMKPYLDRISEFMKRYLDRISKFMKPYLHRISEFMKPYLHRISELSAKAAKSTVKGGTTFITKGREFLGKISTFAPRNNGAPQPPDHSTVGQDGQNATGEGSQYQGEASFGSSSRQRLTLTRHSDVEAGLTEGTGSSGT